MSPDCFVTYVPGLNHGPAKAGHYVQKETALDRGNRATKVLRLPTALVYNRRRFRPTT